MEKSLKALLLSLLLYPGVGHFFLKKNKAGCFFAAFFSLPVFIVLSEIFTKMNQIITRLESGELPFDPIAVTKAISEITSSSDSQLLTINIYVLVVIWIISAFDAYRLGKNTM